MQRIDTDIFIETYSSKSEITTTQIMTYLRGKMKDVSDSTLRWYIHSLCKQSVISHRGRGLYTISAKSEFKPEISKSVKKINSTVRKAFPSVVFCISETRWFNYFMVHQLTKNRIIVEVEKDADEAVFNLLNENFKNVFLNPDDEVLNRYVSSNSESIIVKRMVSQSPIKTISKIKVPEPEKMLVDVFSDIELYSAQQDESEVIFENYTGRFTINESKLKRYANRRNRGKQINELTLKYLSK